MSFFYTFDSLNKVHKIL